MAIIAMSSNLKKYRDVLNDILKQGKYMGKGIKSTDGRYGNLVIDLNKLYGKNKLIASD